MLGPEGGFRASVKYEGGFQILKRGEVAELIKRLSLEERCISEKRLALEESADIR